MQSEITGAHFSPRTVSEGGEGAAFQKLFSTRQKMSLIDFETIPYYKKKYQPFAIVHELKNVIYKIQLVIVIFLIRDHQNLPPLPHPKKQKKQTYPKF